MDVPSREFVLAGSLEELKAKGRLVLHGSHRPILVIYDRGRVFALDNRCPHMGFPLERGSVEDGILTCHWHHARFDLESGCTFDLWADDVPIFPVELRNGQVWVKTTFGRASPWISLRCATKQPTQNRDGWSENRHDIGERREDRETHVVTNSSQVLGQTQCVLWIIMTAFNLMRPATSIC
jgi:nitrite reductase/ring-hydroxylating ferredoxin subunit